MILTGFVFLMLTAALSQAEGQGEVQAIKAITADSVILTCPRGEDGKVTWKKDNNVYQNEKNTDKTVKADMGIVEGLYSCEISDKDVMYFYLNVKVCKNCYELNGLLAWGIIFGDLLLTGGIIIITYMCVPKKTGSTQQKASKSRTSGAPPPPNPDYERLNHNTRSADLYAGLHK